FGPFVSETENQSLLAVQWWTAVLSITAMGLSAGMAERRRVEEELQQQKIVVETANRTKDHFPAMLSHELCAPITPVISALESLETEPAQTEEDESVETKSDLEFQIGLRFHGLVFLSLRRLCLQRFQCGNDRSDWSTKFVRKHGREMVFGPVGGLHNYLLLLKLFLNAPAFGHTGGKPHRRN